MTPKCSTLGSAISTALSTGSTFNRSPPWIPGWLPVEKYQFLRLLWRVYQEDTFQWLTQLKIAFPIFRIARELIKPWDGTSERADQRTDCDSVIPIWLWSNSNRIRHQVKSIMVFVISDDVDVFTVKLLIFIWGIWLLTQRSVAKNPGLFSFMK